MCPYAIIKSYADTPICANTNENCVYFRRCTAQIKWIPLDNIDKCPLKIKQERETPQGSYYVRFIKNGYAYVEIGKEIIKIPYKGEKVQYLYLEDINGEYHIKDL